MGFAIVSDGGRVDDILGKVMGEMLGKDRVTGWKETQDGRKPDGWRLELRRQDGKRRDVSPWERRRRQPSSWEEGDGASLLWDRMRQKGSVTRVTCRRLT